MYLILHLRKYSCINSGELFLLAKHAFLHHIKLVRQLFHCSRFLSFFRSLYENLFWQLHVWSITFAICSRVAKQFFALPPPFWKLGLLVLQYFRVLMLLFTLSLHKEILNMQSFVLTVVFLEVMLSIAPNDTRLKWALLSHMGLILNL